MAHIFSDLSDAALRQVSEDSFFDSLTCLSAIADVEVYDGDDMIRVASPGVPNEVCNAVARCRLSPDNVDSAIEQTNDYFYTRGVVPYWQLCPTDVPLDLADRLAARGFVLQEERPAMVVDLQKLNEDISAPEGFTIERVTDAATMWEKHAWLRALGQGRTLGSLLMTLFTAYGFDPESPWQHYIGSLNGKPVSHASVFYSRGVAGVYAVGTIAEARRQGIGAAITLRGILDARERGYRVGVLQSSAMGLNVYRRLGFETLFNITTYALGEERG